ncbi:hypothetical protein D3C74_290240 [compost metagenome]
MLIAANRVHVFTETCFVKHHPNNGADDDGDNDNVRNGEITFPNAPRTQQIRKIAAQAADRLGLVRIGIEVQRVDSVNGNHGTQSSDKRRNFEFSNDYPVNQTKEQAHCNSDQNRNKHRKLRQIGEETTRIIYFLQHGSRHDRRQTNHPASGQVSTARDENKGHA